ncbi:unnamed protein product, partial [Cyprideis torosa]
VLGHALNAPRLEDTQSAILTLKELGALSSGPRDLTSDGRLTHLGLLMECLPVEPRLGRLVALGHCFGLLSEAATVAAALSGRTLFTSCTSSPLRNFYSKLLWAADSQSDSIAAFNAFSAFQDYKAKTGQRDQREDSPVFGQKTEVHQWASRHFLDFRGLQETEDIQREILERLHKTFDISPQSSENPSSQKEFFFKILLAGAFYPNFYTLNPVLMEDVVRGVSPFDPRRTLYISGLPEKIGFLYKRDIRALIRETLSIHPRSYEPQIHFSSQKAFIVYPEDGESLFPMNMLLAVKFRSVVSQKATSPISHGKFWIRAHNKDALVSAVMQKDKEMPAGGRSERRSSPRPPLGPSLPEHEQPPAIGDKILVTITSFKDPVEFCCLRQEDLRGRLNAVSKRLMVREDLSDLKTEKVVPKPGDVLLAVNEDPNAPEMESGMNRVRVIGTDINQRMCLVEFIDFGNREQVPWTSCYLWPSPWAADRVLGATPPLGLRCRLFGLAANPMFFTSRGGLWSPDAKEFTKSLLHKTADVGQYYLEQGWVTRVLEEDLVLRSEAEGAPLKHKIENTLARSGFPPEDVIRAAAVQVPRDTPLALRPPQSPLETNAHSCFRDSSGRQASPSQESVNSVLLQNPSRPADRGLIVAASVRERKNANLTLFESTLFPPLVGVAPLLALVFCPHGEITAGPTGELTAAITGLRNEKGSILPCHDMVFHLDFEFTEQDLLTINRIRNLLSRALRLSGVSAEDSSSGLGLLQRETSEAVLGLFRERPSRSYPVGPVNWSSAAVSSIPPIALRDQKSHCDSALSSFLNSQSLNGCTTVSPDPVEISAADDHWECTLQPILLTRRH